MCVFLRFSRRQEVLPPYESLTWPTGSPPPPTSSEWPPAEAVAERVGDCMTLGGAPHRPVHVDVTVFWQRSGKGLRQECHLLDLAKGPYGLAVGLPPESEPLPLKGNLGLSEAGTHANFCVEVWQALWGTWLKSPACLYPPAFLWPPCTSDLPPQGCL